LGRLDEIIPPVAIVGKDEPKPYQHLPWEIFQLPFNIVDDLNNIKNNNSTPYPYLIENFTATPGNYKRITININMINVLGFKVPKCFIPMLSEYRLINREVYLRIRRRLKDSNYIRD
jgi:hypothetical protein